MFDSRVTKELQEETRHKERGDLGGLRVHELWLGTEAGSGTWGSEVRGLWCGGVLPDARRRPRPPACPPGGVHGARAARQPDVDGPAATAGLAAPRRVTLSVRADS